MIAGLRGHQFVKEGAEEFLWQIKVHAGGKH